MLYWIDNRTELGISKQVKTRNSHYGWREDSIWVELSDFDTPVIGFNNARKVHGNYVVIIDQPKRFALKIILMR